MIKLIIIVLAPWGRGFIGHIRVNGADAMRERGAAFEALTSYVDSVELRQRFRRTVLKISLLWKLLSLKVSSFQAVLNALVYHIPLNHDKLSWVVDEISKYS